MGEAVADSIRGNGKNPPQLTDEDYWRGQHDEALFEFDEETGGCVCQQCREE